MKKSKENLEHQIQLKKDEIIRYEKAIVNYPPDRMEKYGEPFLQRLNNELQILQNQLDDRESKRDVRSDLGYSRVGMWGRK